MQASRGVLDGTEILLWKLITMMFSGSWCGVPWRNNFMVFNCLINKFIVEFRRAALSSFSLKEFISATMEIRCFLVAFGKVICNYEPLENLPRAGYLFPFSNTPWFNGIIKWLLWTFAFYMEKSIRVKKNPMWDVVIIVQHEVCYLCSFSAFSSFFSGAGTCGLFARFLSVVSSTG